MYFEKSILNTFTHVFQNTILNTFESQYFKKYFKYFSHSIFPNTDNAATERDSFILDKLRDHTLYPVPYARTAHFQNSF